MAAARQVLCLWALLGVPRVRCEPIRYSVAEEGESGSVVADVAEDVGLAPAELSARHARIVSPAGRHHFRFERGTGRLVLAERLDREQMCGRSPTCTLAFELLLVDPLHIVPVEVSVKDINDHSPVFPDERVTFKIPERGDQGSRFPLRAAQDLDVGSNDIQAYSIIPENEFFAVSFRSQIDPKSGEIRVMISLDFETTQKYEFSVRAVDGGGLSSMCKVVVEVLDVNDNAPEVVISSFGSPLPENAEIGTVVALFAVSDQDSGVNGEISCALEDQLSFSLRSDYKNYYELVTISTLDREERAQHIVVVTAADAGSPPLTTTHTFTVDISDVNDNAPIFNQTSYTMFVHENNVPALLVGAVNATDRDAGSNAKVSYSLVPAHPAEQEPCSCVSVNSENGHVFVLRPLDYEQLKQLDVVVSAADAGSPALSSNVTVRLMVVDENDNAPLVLHPAQDSSPPSSEVVPAWAEAGDLVGKVVAVDADSGQNSWLSYELLKATEPGLFAVGAQSGEVRLRRPLTDRDTVKQKLIVLQSPAAEHEDSSLTTYLIVSLVFVSLLFLVSAVAFVACKVCKRKDLSSGHVLYGASNVQSYVADGAASGTLPHAYCYELSLTTGSGNSEFKFLKPILPSLTMQHCSTEPGAQFNGF
ncbi:hypothetical protein ASZ78_007344 [Callipepla squamata]|uniref:Cadherin domain-containing protein n=1 Tax=Callipepla squamata TaxID=9009 RepID=A0A226NBN8_CALSU|nr:hypothetical protein ASZ78_007344 [Callipepla squamata]